MTIEMVETEMGCPEGGLFGFRMYFWKGQQTVVDIDLAELDNMETIAEILSTWNQFARMARIDTLRLEE